MFRTPLRATTAALALLGCWHLPPLGDNLAQAQPPSPYMQSNDLFYNYYVGAGGCSGHPAQLYVSPVPTPPLVGHTWVTYQPLMPHEFLYTHNRTYFSSHPQGGQTVTRVSYRHSPIGQMRPRFGNKPPRPQGVDHLQNPLWRW